MYSSVPTALISRPFLYLLWLLAVLGIHPHGACSAPALAPVPVGQAVNSSPLVLASEAFPSLGLSLILLTYCFSAGPYQQPVFLLPALH